jgi:hypothetical protein
VAFSIYGIRRHPRRLPEQSVEHSAAAMLPGGGELVIAGDSDIIQIYDAMRDRHLEKLQASISLFYMFCDDFDGFLNGRIFYGLCRIYPIRVSCYVHAPEVCVIKLCVSFDQSVSVLHKC